MSNLALLIDTNALISIEDAAGTFADELVRLALKCGHRVFRHPAVRLDIGRDEDLERREATSRRLQKYPELPSPPSMSAKIIQSCGDPAPESNDWVDNLLLSALERDAVDWLVTDDRRLHQRAKRVGLGGRVLRLTEAIAQLRVLAEESSSPSPAVLATHAHAIESTDPILEGFREDYPEFDAWLRRAKLARRLTWIVGDDPSFRDAFAIVKSEDALPPKLHGKVLKICSFKVASHARGRRLGELLLWTIFRHATANAYDWVFVTVFEKHASLLNLLEDFGFQELPDHSALGELVMAKPSRHLQGLPTLHGVEHATRYGPHSFDPSRAWYMVPIRPDFVNRLFPESALSPQLNSGLEPVGNAIRKAYLCNASIRSLTPGSVLVFYRSHKVAGVIALGVVEDVVVTRDPREVVRRVGQRTVYSLAQIERLCDKSVLAISFRLSRTIEPAVGLAELKSGSVVTSAPQSIMRIKPKGVAWLRQLLDV